MTLYFSEQFVRGIREVQNCGMLELRLVEIGPQQSPDSMPGVAREDMRDPNAAQLQLSSEWAFAPGQWDPHSSLEGSEEGVGIRMERVYGRENE